MALTKITGEGVGDLDTLTVDGDVTLNDGSPNLRLKDTDTNRFVDFLYGTRVATFRNTMASGEDMDTVEPSMVFSFKDDGETRTAMTINHDGNVGINNSIPDSFYAGGNNLVVGSGSGSEGITIYGGAESNLFFGDGTAIADNLVGRIEYSHGSNSMLFYTNNSYAMRIDSSGRQLINTSSVLGNGGSAKLQVYGGTGVSAALHSETAGSQTMGIWNSGDSGTRYFVWFESSSGRTNVGSITSNGSSTSYNTSSDYRLKENVTYDWDATTRLKQLKPARFNFIADPDTTVDGFLAHECSAVPEAVTGTKDAMRDEEYEITPAVLDDDGNEVTPAEMGTRSVPDYQGIDQAKLVPLLVKTIQELEARITALEAE